MITTLPKSRRVGEKRNTYLKQAQDDPRKAHDALNLGAIAREVLQATPVQLVEIERRGVNGAVIAELSERMAVPASRLFAMLRIPRATAARKATGDAVLQGRAGQAAIGLIQLLGLAQDLVADSTARAAQNFDVARWLGQWLELPQPALGGRKAADFLDTPTGVALVRRLLGSLQSGAYV
jgi:putative toxin-antitoxin system antitoxin component (TIGR02293 family)